MANNNDMAAVMQSLNELRQLVGTLGQSIQQGQQDVDRFSQTMKSASFDLGKGFGQVYRAASEGAGLMSKYNGAIDSFTGSISKVASQFGLLGKSVGAVVQVIGFAAKSVSQLNDNVIRGYDALAKFGVAGRMSTEELRKMGLNAGFANDELDEYSGLIRASGADILTLGKSATAGYKALGKLTEADAEYIGQMSKLGLTQQDLVRNTVDYIKLQSMTGISMKSTTMSVDELKTKTREYNRNLIELSDFTGLEVEEVKRRQEIARASIDVQTKLMMMQDEESKLRSSGNIAEADRIKTEMENSKKLLDVAAAIGLSGENLAAVQSMVSTDSFTELSSSFAAGMPDILNFIKAVKEGKKAPEELTKFIAENNERNRKQFGTAITLDKQLGSAVAYNTETIQIESRYRNLSKEDIVKDLEERRKQRDEALNSQKKENDSRLEARANLISFEQSVKRLRDEFIVMTDKTLGLTKIFGVFFDIMKNVTDFIGKALIKVGFLDEKNAAYFMKPEEIVEQLSGVADELRDVRAQLAVPATDPEAQLNISGLESRERELVESQRRLSEGYSYATTGQRRAAPTGGTFMQRLAMVESSGDPNAQAKGSSAGGLFQFTDKTITGLGYKPEDKFDLAKAEKAAELLRKQNLEALRKSGLPNIGDTEEYLLWFFGQGDGIKFIKELGENRGQMGASLFESAAKSNPNIFYKNGAKKEEPRTLHEIYELLEKKLIDAGVNIGTGKAPKAITDIKAQFGGIFDGPLSGYDSPHRADMQMHQTELIQPLNKNSILQELATKSVSEIINTSGNQNNNEMMSVLISKVDDMISLLRNSNDIQNDILSYGMA